MIVNKPKPFQWPAFNGNVDEAFNIVRLPNIRVEWEEFSQKMCASVNWMYPNVSYTIFGELVLLLDKLPVAPFTNMV